jgi:hypothetical protein
MASLEQAETERRALQLAGDLADDIDRELDRAVVTLETLATSAALSIRDFAAFHEQAARALRRDKAGILLIDRNYQQVLNTRAPFGQTLPKTDRAACVRQQRPAGLRFVRRLCIGSARHQRRSPGL